MENAEPLFELLKSTNQYWVGARRTTYSSGGSYKRGKDDVVLFARPRDLPVVEEPEAMSYKEIERLLRTVVEANIFLSAPSYPPFQWGVSLGCFYRLFPLDGVDVNKFVEKSKTLDIHDIWVYQELVKSMVNPEAPTNE